MKQKTISQNPDVLKLLADAQRCFEARDFDQANALLQQVLLVEPENIHAINSLATIAIEVNMLDVAEDLLLSALKVDADNTVVIKNLALTYARLKRINKAISTYGKLLTLDNKQAFVHGELARLNLYKGETEQAVKHYRRAFRLEPSDPRNFHGLLQLDFEHVGNNEISVVKKQLKARGLSLASFRSFNFGLAYYYDKCERYDEAFSRCIKANADSTLDAANEYDAAAQEDMVSDIIQTFDADLFKHHAAAGNKTTRPVFIVGMPRSGSTLVEQILATQPQVHAAGELNTIDNLSKAIATATASADDQQTTYPEVLKTIQSEVLTRLADSHDELLGQLATNDESFVTDKMPANFLHLGLIALMFPNAHIIVCERNPLDVCLSCYFQNFAANHPYAGDLLDLGHYYQQYQRLMNHWIKVLPINIHVVNYEELVQQPDAVSQQLMAYMGLNWTPEYRDFHQSGQHVNTASVAQVRKPLYQTSVQRWKHYEQHLKQLIRLLEVKQDQFDKVKAGKLTINRSGESMNVRM